MNNLAEETERWAGLDEVANHLGVSKDTLRYWIKKGSVPNYKVGRKYKFRISEIDQWVKSGKSAAADK